MYSGSFVAMITPFKDGKVDEQGVADLVEFQLRNGTNGLVPCGTTGEAVTLSDEEHLRVVEITIETAGGRVPIVAGTGTNSTEKTIKTTKAVAKIGADAALVVTPYYNKPTPEGLFQHYKAINDAVDLPIVAYNVPTRTSVNMSAETTLRISGLPNVIAVKEASGSMDQVSEILQDAAPDFAVMSGDDSVTLPLLALGGTGVVSVVANIAPAAMSDLVAAFHAGDVARARELHHQIFGLCRAMFIETNPIPVKTAAGMLGLCSDELRLPLVALSEGNRAKLKAALDSCPLIQPIAV
jgi:4-hydroxy-tetrahydrodipicolinate synthase